MKRKMRRVCSWLCAAAVSATVFSEPVLANSLNSAGISAVSETDMTMPFSDENGVTVTSDEEFLQALEEKKSPIIVDNLITIGKEEENDGRMRPVMIPGNTVITGTTKGIINSRAPIQLEGDGVCFQNIGLQFESADALNSVPHREIFLAGHSLILDNVSTYLEGSGGEFGPLGGTEEEVLPTVYAGGYPNTQIGTNASLTVQNSNEETMFKGIYMGHKAGNDNNVPYNGNAVLEMDSKALVREGVYTDQNSLARIQITGDGEAKAKRFYGNENTTLTIQQSSMTNHTENPVIIEGIKHLVLNDGADLAPQSNVFCDVTLRNDACLDLNGMKSAVITGDFNGGEDQAGKRGILVLNSEGVLTIEGSVSGTTQFQTGHRLFPGTLLRKKYITAKRDNESEMNFVLPEKKLEEGYGLNYSEGTWIVSSSGTGWYEEPQIGSIEIISAPKTVDVTKIMEKSGETVLEPSAACRIVWKDPEGNPFGADTVEEEWLYGFDHVIGIKTEYWDSEDPKILTKTDWYNTISLVRAEEEADTYYLQAAEGVQTGDYTFLFCSKYFSGDLNTVADVKALKDTVKAKMRIQLYDGEKEEQPVVPDKPSHVHQYKAKITRESTCTKKGLKTFQCTGCKNSYTQELPLKAHTYKTVLTKAAPGRDGNTVKKCSVCQKVSGKTMIYQPKTMTLSASTYTYNGSSRKPKVSVKDNKGKVIESSQYTVACQNNKNVGQASVTVKFKDRYSGTMNKTFTILPKASVISKLTAKSKAVVVKWEKQSTQTDGYEIQCSTSKKFSKKTTKTVTVKK